MRRISTIVLALLVLALGFATPTGAITNADGPAANAPWLATIWVKDINGGPDIQLCGATLITPTALLTAAHCVATQQVAYVKFPLAKGYQDRRVGVSARLWHQRYSKESFVNDIAILRLSEPVKGVQVMRLPPVNDMPLREMTGLSVIGYGEDQNGYRPSSASKARQQDMSSEGGVYFDSFNEELMIAAARYIARERIYSGACRGDSGGPLFAKFGTTDTILGVVSYGASDCNTAKPTAYTRVSGYLEWIKEALAAK